MTKLKAKWDQIPIAVKVSIAYAVCSILQRCLSFITLPLFTRLLTTEQYGQYTIYQSWQGILSIILTLNLAYGSFSTAMVKFEKDRDGYISAVEGICLMLSLIFMVIYLPFRAFWNKVFELPTLFVILMVIGMLTSTATSLWCGKMRFQFKYKAVVILTLCMSVTSPLLAYILVMNTEEKGYARILGYVGVTIIVGIFFYFLNAVRGKKFLNKEYWKYALGFNLPLIPYYLSQVVFNQSDRIMISHMVSTGKAAIYGVAYALATLLTFVLNAINNSYIPWYYGKIKEGKQEENRRVSIGIAVIMGILLLGVIWFTPEIIKIMAAPEYFEAIHVVPPVAVSIFLLLYSQFFINVEFYYEEKMSLVWASIAAAVANLVLNWIFIKIYGYVAAAYTTLFSYILFAFANYLAMKRVLKKRQVEDNAYNYKWLILLFLLFCVMTVAGALLYNYLVVRIIIAAIILVIIIIKRNKLLEFYRIIKNKQEQKA